MFTNPSYRNSACAILPVFGYFVLSGKCRVFPKDGGDGLNCVGIFLQQPNAPHPRPFMVRRWNPETFHQHRDQKARPDALSIGVQVHEHLAFNPPQPLQSIYLKRLPCHKPSFHQGPSLIRTLNEQDPNPLSLGPYEYMTDAAKDASFLSFLS